MSDREEVKYWPTEEYKRVKKLGELPYTDLIVEKKYPIGWITLNRPDKRNTITTFPGGTADQLCQAYREMAEDSNIRVFILKGNGDCFCAGFDLSAGQSQFTNPREKGWARNHEREPWTRLSSTFPDNPESSYDILRWWGELWDNPKPSIALVHSFCAGAALWNINMFDIVLASPEALFGYPPVRYGCPIVGQILPTWLLGFRQTMDMALTGRYMSAEEAYNCGLITKIIPEEELIIEGRKKAESIAKVPPMTNWFTKMTVHHYYEMLGVKEWANYAINTCYMGEHAMQQGGLFDFGERIKQQGFTTANLEQRELYGYPDPLLEQERSRLKTKHR